MNMLACPFCGGTKLSIDRKSVLDGYSGLDDRVERHTYSVRCHTCFARGGAVGGRVIPYWRHTRLSQPDWATTDTILKEKAVAAWNNRK